MRYGWDQITGNSTGGTLDRFALRIHRPAFSGVNAFVKNPYAGWRYVGSQTTIVLGFFDHGLDHAVFIRAGGLSLEWMG